MGENAILNATGTGNIIWQDENGDFLGEGNEFVSEPLYENTTFYVLNENVLIQASETLSTGALEHEGSSDYSGTIYNGGLLFDCFETFTLNSVKVYTDEEGERTIELHNADGDIVNSLLVNIPATDDNGYVIELDWEIPVGSNYILTTNFQMNNDNFGNNNPMLKRTTDDLPNFPYTIDGILEISEGMYDDGDGPGFSTSYYYYFYDWQINNDWGIGGSTCLSDIISVDVFINNNNTVIDENNNSSLDMYPNPAHDQLNIVFNNAVTDNTIILLDHLGKVCDNIKSQNIEAGGKITIDVSNLSSGLYFIHLINDNTSLKESFTVSK